MIDNKAVMQQALNAIRNSIPTPLPINGSWELRKKAIDGSWELRKKAIEWLEAAIAQPEQKAVPITVAQYSRCSDTLRNLGKSYPRTCAECGLGPCKTKPAQPEQSPYDIEAAITRCGSDRIIPDNVKQKIRVELELAITQSKETK